MFGGHHLLPILPFHQAPHDLVEILLPILVIVGPVIDKEFIPYRYILGRNQGDFVIGLFLELTIGEIAWHVVQHSREVTVEGRIDLDLLLDVERIAAQLHLLLVFGSGGVVFVLCEDHLP